MLSNVTSRQETIAEHSLPASWPEGAGSSRDRPFDAFEAIGKISSVIATTVFSEHVET